MEHCHGNILQEDYSSVALWYQTEPHKPWDAIKDAKALEPLPEVPGYLMTELHTDPPENVERRTVLHKAAQLRYRLRIDPGSVPGVTEDMIMSARYEELKKLVERHI